MHRALVVVVHTHLKLKKSVAHHYVSSDVDVVVGVGVVVHVAHPQQIIRS